ncbi:hypothetical protein ACFS7Z_19845 [Pontibacter toksunensis]|uniref:Uncharacterized protein n=1 Tax=Pontibacter toksunensis TaxID=1332631 RepID=A0ABW6C044_9BACT
MRRLYYYFFFLLTITSCSDPVEPSVKPTPPQVEKVIPPGSRKVTIKVDSKYNFNNVNGYSFTDSTSINSDPSLIVPNNGATMLYFTDKASGNLLATVRVDSSMAEVEVNATSVSISLFELIPTYGELTPNQQREFEANAITTDAFKSLVAVVDGLLQNRSQIYSTDPKFVKSLSDLNKIIITSYLADSQEGGRIRQGPNPGDPATWILQDENVIDNQVHSYVDVLLISDNKSKSGNFIMGPRPFKPGFHERKGLSNNDDGYYELRLTQNTNDAELKNGVAATEKVLSIVLGAALDKYLKANGAGCREEIVNKVGIALNGILIQAKTTPTGADEVQEAMFDAAFGISKDVLTSEKCIAGIAVTAFIARAIAFKAHWVTTTIIVLWNTSDVVQVSNLIEAFLLPIEHTVSIQLHHGAIIPGQFTMLPAIELKEEYKAEEQVPIQVSLKELTKGTIPFENRLLSVNWIVEEGNGKITNQTKTITIDERTGSVDGEEWFGSALWTLPSSSGTFKASVEILDKNKKHIEGSPIVFTTKTTNLNIIGKWQVNVTGKLFNNQGVLLETYSEDELHHLEFIDSNQMLFYYYDGQMKEIIDRGTYSLDSQNNLLTITGVLEDDWNGRYKISNYTPSGFVMKTVDKINEDTNGEYYEIEMKVKK